MTADDPRGDVPGAKYLTTEELRRDVSALREIIQARLDGMDRAAVVLSETVNRTPTDIQVAISHLKELIESRIAAAEVVSRTRLGGIEQQFVERDVRTEQAATASSQALSAALQAAKEAVFEQAQAAAKAAEKTELSFSKQIDQTQIQIQTVAEGLGDKIDDLKGRLDRGEGADGGSAASRAELRLKAGTLLTMMSVIIAALILAVALYAALHKP